MPRLAQIAVQRALLNREVVRIELPIDVSEQAVPSLHQVHELVRTPSTLIPPIVQLDHAADLINDGKKIAIFAGVGCREAKDDVIALSKRLHAPITHTLKGKDIFDYDDPNVVGMTGLIGNPGGYHAVNDCDVLIMLGTDFPYEWFLPEKAKIIQVDRSIKHLGRRAPIAAGLLGDVKATLDLLLPKLIKNLTRSSLIVRSNYAASGWSIRTRRPASTGRWSLSIHKYLRVKFPSKPQMMQCLRWTLANAQSG
ncbi:hypothetical protein C8024_05885 [Sphingopyxis sp. BSNA05]|nr:hypothetical protein [Sphingopyxis sp. BSNA05]